jgi:predicted Rossmann fold flavoprotein
VKTALAERLQARLAEALLDVAKVAPDRRLAALAKDERRRVVSAVKANRVTVTGDRGYALAEVTSGGVDLAEVDPKTLESRKQPGLHFAGEVLDLDGPIGGFNFQAAWSTGWLAGSVM